MQELYLRVRMQCALIRRNTLPQTVPAPTPAHKPIQAMSERLRHVLRREGEQPPDSNAQYSAVMFHSNWDWFLFRPAVASQSPLERHGPHEHPIAKTQSTAKPDVRSAT